MTKPFANRITAKTTFSDIVEAIDQLPLEDQENLIHLLQNRLREQKRSELVRGVYQAQQEFVQGKCKPVTPAPMWKIFFHEFCFIALKCFCQVVIFLDY